MIGPPAVWLSAAATLVLIALLLLFVLSRRVIRAHWFRIRDRRAQSIRKNWQKIVTGEIPPAQWCSRRLDRQIVEDIALDRMDVASQEEAELLRPFFRDSGLLDQHKYDARKRHGWHRHHALLTIGRMRVLESIPTLVESLEHGPDADAVAGIRALGRIGNPEAGAAIVRRLARPLPSPREAIESALITCFQSDPATLVSLTLLADDSVRPVLARVLAAVAVPEIPDGWSTLTIDPVPEVRAASARILAIVRPPGASMVFAMLAEDSEWFVRLRATVALGGLADPFTIPILIERLCDPNRLVRLRAASALGRMKGEESHILALANRTTDRYALQALVSEFERSGNITRMVDELAQPGAVLIHAGLLTAARGGAVRLLADLALRHANRMVRQQLLEILNEVDEPATREYLELIQGSRQEPAAVSSEPTAMAEVTITGQLSVLLGATEGQMRVAPEPVAAP
jgi:HEAT repeat protein